MSDDDASPTGRCPRRQLHGDATGRHAATGQVGKDATTRRDRRGGRSQRAAGDCLLLLPSMSSSDVARHMPGRGLRPIDRLGARQSTSGDGRRVLRRPHGAVLVAQIIAGGVGLNIQAASVVVICEPQFKPTTEWQAIARAHRMGQLESVQVHRLLSDEGIDLRLREILAAKKEMFESFARESETAASAPEAYDVTEAELTREILADERQRLFGQSAPSGPTQPPVEAKADNVPDVSQPPRRDPPPGGPSTAPPTHAAHVPSAPAQAPGLSQQPTVGSAGDRFADRTRRVAALQHEGSTLPSATQDATSTGQADLKPYPVFSQTLSPISQTPADQIIENLVRIVSVEGPMTGWRIHQVYKKCAPGRESHDEFSRLLNRDLGRRAKSTDRCGKSLQPNRQ